MDIKAIWLHTLKTERRITRETIEAMTDDDMPFKPTEVQMSFGAQALHVISCQKTLLDALQGKGWEWEQGYKLEDYPTREAILAAYDKMHLATMGYFERLEPEQFDRTVSTPWGPPEPLLQLLMSFLVHEGHHRGQLVTYLRLKGMQPPRY